MIGESGTQPNEGTGNILEEPGEVLSTQALMGVLDLVRAEDGSGDRRPEDLPPEEIANAALEILRGHVSMTMLDLSRETARRLGYSRLGSRLTEAMEEGIRLICARGSAKLEGDLVSLP